MFQDGSSSNEDEEASDDDVEESEGEEESMEDEEENQEEDEEDSDDDTNNNRNNIPITKTQKMSRKEKRKQILLSKITMKENDNVPKASSSTEVSSSIVNDEYEVDSSDEEDVRNTVGNIPMEWYKEFLHIGYDLDGKQIIKPKSADELEEFLNKMDNPNYWYVV